MKKLLNFFLLSCLLIMMLMSGCTRTPTTPGAIASNYLSELSQMDKRVAGTVAEVAAADWIVENLSDAGYTAQRNPFQYDDGDIKTSQNIVADKNGRRAGTIIIGAHYDAVNAGSGIDDNASGTALALELATILKKAPTPHSIKFVFYGAEEVGLKGSSEYATRLSDEEIDETILVINLDSLVAGDIAYVYGNNDENGRFRDHVLALAKREDLNLVTHDGVDKAFPRGITGPWSDHAPFEALGMPFIYFESTNWEMGERDGYTQTDLSLGENGEIWHTQYDNIADIETLFPGRIDERLSLFSTVLQYLLMEDLSTY